MQIGSTSKTGRFITLLLFSGVVFLNANAQLIQNVKFTTAGKQIVITYDIAGAQSGQLFDVSVFCSTDGGKTLGSPLSRISGDEGPGIAGGSGKRITWDVLTERDNLVGNVLFEVQAKSSGTSTTASSQTRMTQTQFSSSADPYWAEIPGGTFMMGSASNETGRIAVNETQHLVTLSPFKMSKNEVTFDEYDAFCIATRRRKPDEDGWGRGTRPVINVSWMDAKAFADWKGYRLPTEAEWEYACRAGTTSPFSTGDNLTTDQANFNGNEPYNNNSKGKALGKTQPVGSYAPNAWGLYDMHGNVSEWVNDYFGVYSAAEQTNPKGPDQVSYRIRRGGSWYDSGAECRSASRIKWPSDKIDRIVGIRLVSDK
ncbi:MAG: formylglycine-generating enzyme family protein [Bacteroidia bacterium]|nr:formylglycine-generating enzyme family protein [Bacteroidia bacterium]